MSLRGFTLVEVLVALGLGTGVAVLGLMLTADFQRFYHRHTAALGTSQSLRRAVELIAQDIRNAGIGVGYRPDGRFGGFLMGAFEVEGGARFQAEDRALETLDGTLPVDDLGVRRALGQRRTVLFLDPGIGEICSGLRFQDNELVSVISRTGRSARTLRITGAGPTACSEGGCRGGCTRITWSADAHYLSHPEAGQSRFASGDLFQDYETVVWFVVADPNGWGQLRRLGEGRASACSTVDLSCGVEVLEGVELLQYAIWSYDMEAQQWVAAEKDGELRSSDRVRVDLELVARGRSDPGVGRSPALSSQLHEGLCIPAPCGTMVDQVPREVLRTTVEVRNAGRLRIL